MNYSPVVSQDKKIVVSFAKIVIPNEPALNVKQLCADAGIPYRVSGGRQADIFIDKRSELNLATIDNTGKKIYLIGTKNSKTTGAESAVRLLETLAYAYFDYAARESVISARLWVLE